MSPLRWTDPKPFRILDFDIENRPLSYWYEGQCTAEITAIAASWVGDEHVQVWLLGEDDPSDMLVKFRALYDLADMTTGHYIRKHDLPIINGAMIEYELPPLDQKLTSDTKLDLIKFKDLAASQEALSAMLGISAPKEQMTQNDWREANRLTPEGLRQTRRRVTGDVKQHKVLRPKLIEANLLDAPQVWRP